MGLKMPSLTKADGRGDQVGPVDGQLYVDWTRLAGERETKLW